MKRLALCVAFVFVFGLLMEVRAQSPDTVTVLPRGDNLRSGVHAVTGLPEMTAVRWEKQIEPTSFGSPILADGILLVCMQGNAGRGIVAFDAATGEEKWEFASRDTISEVSVIEGVVYAAQLEGKVLALDLATGELLSEFVTEGAVWAVPAVSEDALYFATDSGFVYALDRATQTEIWHIETGERFLFGSIYHEEILYVVANEVILALDATNGEEVWRSPEKLFWYPMAMTDGVIFAGADDSTFYALDATTGEPLWIFAGAGDSWSSPVVAEGRVYVGNKAQIFYALDATSGEPVWTFATEDEAVADPVYADGLLYFGETNHDYPAREGNRNLYIVNAETGAEVWHFTAASRIFSAPALGEGELFLVTFRGNIYALE